MNITNFFLSAILMFSLFGCNKKSDAFVHFKIKFDPLQERLNSTGLASNVAPGRAAQTPSMNSIGISALEISPNSTTPFGLGMVVLTTAETIINGTKAIDFAQVKTAREGDIFISIPIQDITPGKYEWIRTSVAYQNLDIQFNLTNAPSAGNFLDERGTLATFIGYNNYVSKHKTWSKEETINDYCKQGFWLFESKLQTAYSAYNKVYSGQTAGNSITFVNPITQTSPYPNGACAVTGRFDTPLSISGKEEQDITVVLTLSVNRSIEWEETITRNGKWDINMQSRNDAILIEPIMDMGLRGLKAAHQTK